MSQSRARLGRQLAWGQAHSLSESMALAQPCPEAARRNRLNPSQSPAQAATCISIALLQTRKPGQTGPHCWGAAESRDKASASDGSARSLTSGRQSSRTETRWEEPLPEKSQAWLRGAPRVCGDGWTEAPSVEGDSLFTHSPACRPHHGLNPGLALGAGAMVALIFVCLFVF